VGEGRTEGTGADDDPFAELRAACFFDDAPREPSAEERAAFAWTTQAEVPGLAGYIAGLAGPAGAPDPSDSTGTLAWVTGQVALDAEDLGAGLSLPGGDIRARAVIQHELGHLVGLDHVADPAQLMYSEGNDAQVGDWGSGDLAGLHQLGKGECLPEL